MLHQSLGATIFSPTLICFPEVGCTLTLASQRHKACGAPRALPHPGKDIFQDYFENLLFVRRFTEHIPSSMFKNAPKQGFPGKHYFLREATSHCEINKLAKKSLGFATALANGYYTSRRAPRFCPFIRKFSCSRVYTDLDDPAPRSVRPPVPCCTQLVCWASYRRIGATPAFREHDSGSAPFSIMEEYGMTSLHSQPGDYWN